MYAKPSIRKRSQVVTSYHETSSGLSEDPFLGTAWIKAAVGQQEALEQQLTQAWLYCQKQLAPEHISEAPVLLIRGRTMVMRLLQFTLDGECLQAALLFPWIEAGRGSLSLIAPNFSPVIAQLLQGVQQLALERAAAAAPSGVNNVQLNTRRRMLLAIIRDVRCVMIRLVERLSVLKESKQWEPSVQQNIATACQQLYIPLARCLGIGQLKWELEDLSWRALHPQAYRQLAQRLHERRSVREQEIVVRVQQLQTLLQREGVTAAVSGRPKHLYSIWQKMQKKGKSFDQLFDVRALRIIVEDIPACYAVLSLLHARYLPLSEEFSDYIAHPKPNGYRSIHTIVLDEQGEPIEVQIRTSDMHRAAELGMAAHWRYKEEDLLSGKIDPRQRISWLRRLLSWHVAWTMTDNPPDLSSMETPKWIYLFTPQQDVIELPMGATPIDFAYAIHTEIGHRCVGARVDGRIVPLTYLLQMGQQVVILTQKAACPRRDWLNSSAGLIKTRRARVRIRAWLKRQDCLRPHDEPRRALKNPAALLVEVARKTGSNNQKTAVKLPVSVNRAASETFEIKKIQVKVAGVDNLLVTFARCCHPSPGERIRGFITRGRGVSIHRADCFWLKELQRRMPAHLTSAQWCVDRLHSKKMT